jgi:hypothetical protein
VDPEIIISRVSHEFGHAGGFYFRKKQIQCEETMTPFIIYFLYTFNDIATIREELTSLLKEALKDMKDDYTLPDEFEFSPLPVINIRRGVPKLPGQPGSNFRDYSREMQEARRAHLIKCDIKAIPFLRTVINYIKESKFISSLKLYSKKKGIVLYNGWHTQLLNLNKDTKVQWMYSGATIFKFKEIKEKYFLVDKTPYCYLEDLDFTYSLYKEKKTLMCISKARILNPNIYTRNKFEFGFKEIKNRYDFVKKNNLNPRFFFLTSLIKFAFIFFEIFKFKFEIIPRLAGNFSGIIYCLTLNSFRK